MWVSPDSVNADGTLLSQYGAGEFDVSIWLELVNGRPVLIFGDGEGEMVTVSSTVTLPKDKWSHITIIRDGNIASIYVGGVLVGSESYDFEPVEVDSNLLLSNGEYEGKIDEFRIYKEALTETDIDILASLP